MCTQRTILPIGFGWRRVVVVLKPTFGSAKTDFGTWDEFTKKKPFIAQQFHSSRTDETVATRFWRVGKNEWLGPVVVVVVIMGDARRVQVETIVFRILSLF
jgi:hypothetical protein